MRDPTYVSGLTFERHVMGLFGGDFKILKWMSEGATNEEIGLNPDLEVEHIGSGDRFGVECKYRSSAKLPWAKEYQLKKYCRYRESGKPLFIVVGLGGSPDRPGYMYCIPAWQATKARLDIDSLKRYRRSPLRKFRWDPKGRWLI